MKSPLSTFILVFALGLSAQAKKLSFEEMIFKSRPKLKEDLKKPDWSLDKSAEKKGLIKLKGTFEGRDQYFLFRGKPSDLLIHDAKEEGLEFHQDFEFFLFTNGKMKKLKKTEAFPDKKLNTAVLRGQDKIAAIEKDSKWGKYFQSFELMPGDRKVKVVLSNDDPAFYDPKSGLKAIVGQMIWDGRAFQLKEVKKISLDKMFE